MMQFHFTKKVRTQKMIEILDFEEIKQLANNTLISGLALGRSFEKKPTKNGGEYLEGSLNLKGVIVPCKIWNSSPAFSDKTLNGFNQKTVSVSGKTNIYQNNLSIIIDDISEVSPEDFGYTTKDFQSSKYDNHEDFIYQIEDIFREKLEPRATEYLIHILNNVRDRFVNEFAASRMHDATLGGLLAHTYKMLLILDTIWSCDLYKNITQKVDKDLIFLSLVFHDIGKIFEYDMGARTEIAYATHNFLGQEYLFEFKNDIIHGFKSKRKHINGYGLDFYYRLQSVIMQHHGEYGEPCHTKEAYIVHLIDMLESRLTILDEALLSNDTISLDYGKIKLV